ncbi:BSD domain-containing protein [Madurella fahalii]|uniref:BSD domain-containing protein n=1 Tax=Madurella fahalii TaxID=1157608 RepID=A0ABQ0G035_9PEZI
MGASVSTLVGWAVVIGFAYVVVFGLPGKKNARDALRGASQRQRLEDRQTRKEPKEKAKRQRVEAYSKDAEEANKTTQPKPRAPKPQTSGQSAEYSSDDGVDNREFARQLASVKQGTSLNAPKKGDEKRQKSVKQSRAQIIDEEPSEVKISAPSSTAGVDADDDESSTPSPEIKAVDAGDVSDMLEPKASGPSVLRLTDTDKAKQKKEKKAKSPEKVETKKQRQNRQKAEAAKALREETEKQRKIDMEAQRRQARIAEGRPAKDGSAFTAAQAPQSVWTGNGVKGSPSSSATNGEYVPVQPLDTFDTSSYTDVSAPKSATAAQNTAESWMASLPSEEEQMEMLRGEEAWSTVTTKKSGKKKKEATAESPIDSEPTVVQSQPVTQPRTINGATGKSAKPISQQSAFAALSTNDEPEVETEWDV